MKDPVYFYGMSLPVMEDLGEGLLLVAVEEGPAVYIKSEHALSAPWSLNYMTEPQCRRAMMAIVRWCSKQPSYPLNQKKESAE